MKKFLRRTVSAAVSFAIVFSILCALPITANQYNMSYGDVPKVSHGEIRLDGMMESAYQDGALITMTRGFGNGKVPIEGYAYLVYDDDALYVYVVVNDSSYGISFEDNFHICNQCCVQMTYMDKANQEKPTCEHVTADNADKYDLWNDDCVELYIDWENDGEGSPSQCRVSRSGIASHDWYIRDLGFNAKSYDIGNYWAAEIAIPLDSCARGTAIGINCKIHSQESFDPWRESGAFADNSFDMGEEWQSQYYDYIVLGDPIEDRGPGGNCGSLTWTLDASGDFTVGGSGTMIDFSHASDQMWNEYRDKITNVQIGNKVTSIGDYAFASCPALKKVIIPDSVTSIGNAAFVGCPNLKLYGYDGSYAQEYASENGIPFVAVAQLGGRIFTDVLAGDWYVDAVRYAVDNTLFNGVSTTEFAPAMNMDRAMLVTVLWRAEGEPMASESTRFIDVPENEYYSEAVRWASSNGIVNGMGGGEFVPKGNITREQMATILYRYAEQKGYDLTASADLNAFPDGTQTSSYAQTALAWACGSGLIGGSDGKLLPQDGATRAQVATILMRYQQNIAE